MAQLSNGTDIGDSGIFYFPREVINNDFKWDGYCLVDMSREEVERLQQFNITPTDNWLQELWKIFKGLTKIT